MLDIPEFYKGQHWSSLFLRDDLTTEVLKVKLVQDYKLYTDFLEPFLKDLKEAGYKKVWIGTGNPYWKREMWSSMVVASPSTRARRGFGLELWDILQKYGKLHAGNGLQGADQVQGPGWLCLISGEYEL